MICTREPRTGSVNRSATQACTHKSASENTTKLNSHAVQVVRHARKLLPGVVPALLQLPRVCGSRARPGYHFYHHELREARRAPPLASQRARRVETSQAARGRIMLGNQDVFH